MSVPYKPPTKILDWLVGEEATRNDLKAKIAARIRAELVCCDMYDQVQNKVEELHKQGKQAWDVEEHILGYHAICHWGEAAARIAEQIDDIDEV